jgi:hypothetical protein
MWGGENSMRMKRLFEQPGRYRVLLLCLLGLMALSVAGPGNNLSSALTPDPSPSRQMGVNPAIARFEPALAVRTSACITCHAKIYPGFITDFGYGDGYFFGKSWGGSRLGPFDGSIYGDFYGGEPNKTGWFTAEMGKIVVVPKAPFDFDLGAAGTKLSSAYRKPLQARTLAEYLSALEAQKKNPATIVEKERVFIGAPNAATLESRFGIKPGSGTEFKYIKDDKTSPEIQGITLLSGKGFFSNTAEVACDGDLFIRGTLFLNRAAIATKSGCRVYATGPIFVQDAITYKNLGGSTDKTNLQLVSAEAILLGLGDKSCDAAAKDSPLSRRLVSGYAISSFFTRDAVRRSISPKDFGQGIYEKGKMIEDLEDAGCRDDTLGFSRLLLNAPQIHNRYKGRFKGLVIAEVVLFRLGKSTIEFDPVFKEVPILPMLNDSDYLEVK